MRYPASEKLEIIRLVEQSHLPVKRTLAKLCVARATFYLYGRLSRCKSTLELKRLAPLQTSIRRHPMRSERPNGEAARARLYSW
jgi:hypothetical protein